MKKVQRVQERKARKTVTADAAVSSLQMGLEALSRSHHQLAVACGQNTRAFVDAHTAAEANIHVLQRVLNDVLFDQVALSNGVIDFQKYMVDYLSVVGFTAFVKWAKENSTDEEVAPVDDNVVVFGG